MRRRALLGTVGASVTAGCLGNVLHLSRGEPRFSIENDPVSDDFPATLSAELLTEATADHPPRIRIAFEHTGDAARTFRFSYPGPFADTLATAEGGAELVLKYEATEDNHHDECWWATTSYGGSATEHRRFDPGEQTHIEWAVLTHEGTASCYPSGRYRFKDEYHVDGGTYEWGFWFRIH